MNVGVSWLIVCQLGQPFLSGVVGVYGFVYDAVVGWVYNILI